MEIFGKIPDWLKLPPYVFFAIVLVTAFLLFLHDSTQTLPGVSVLVAQHRGWFELVFLLALVLLATSFGTSIWPSVKGIYKDWKTQKARIKRLYQLTPEEKDILREYLRQNTRTLTLVEDGVVMGLVKAGVIVRAGTRRSIRDARDRRVDYNLELWAWEYLQKNPQILDD